MADRQVALAAGAIEINLSSEGPGKVKLDKVSITIEEMGKLMGLRQGELVVSFLDGNGENLAAVESSSWDLAMKPKVLWIALELRRRPEVPALMGLRKIQQELESEDLTLAVVVLRPLQVADLEEEPEEISEETATAILCGKHLKEVVDGAVETFNEQAPEGVTARLTSGGLEE